MIDDLRQVNQLYQDRAQRARQLKAEGKGVIGYLCTFTPVELITAAGLLPYRLTGSAEESITEADRHLETIACPYTRSILDLALKDRYSFLDGIVMPHSCDNVVNLYNVWSQRIDHSFAHFVNVPHTLSAPSIRFFETELNTFKQSLEKYTGREITREDLCRAIASHNEQRSLVRELYGFRKQDPAAISGSEMTKTIVAVMSLPVDEANSLLRQVILEIEKRKNGLGETKEPGVRLMIHGTGNDETTFMEIVEGTGAQVVVDDLCFGTRPYSYEVEVTEEPLAGLAESYLNEIHCPRTYRPSPGTHQEDLENRFGHIYTFAREYNVKGVILYILRYCDTHAFDAPDLKEYLEGKGLPVLQLDEDYPTSSIARLKIRVQAFVEVVA